jgi:hypothetical protein
MALKHTMTIAGPACNASRETVHRIRSYSIGWTELRFETLEMAMTADGRVDKHWATGGTVPPCNGFMGESGGCVYMVARIANGYLYHNQWRITLLQLSSSRKNRKQRFSVFTVPFPVEAIAIDGIQEVVVIFQTFVFETLMNCNLLRHRFFCPAAGAVAASEAPVAFTSSTSRARKFVNLICGL